MRDDPVFPSLLWQISSMKFKLNHFLYISNHLIPDWLAWLVFSTTRKGRLLKTSIFVDFSINVFIKQYNSYSLFTHVKLGSNIAAKNVLQVYVTKTTTSYVISIKIIIDVCQPNSLIDWFCFINNFSFTW